MYHICNSTKTPQPPLVTFTTSRRWSFSFSKSTSSYQSLGQSYLFCSKPHSLTWLALLTTCLPNKLIAINDCLQTIWPAADRSSAVVYLAGQVDIKVIDPVECGDACLNGVVKHLSCQYRDNWWHVQISLRISDTAVTLSTMSQRWDNHMTVIQSATVGHCLSTMSLQYSCL